MRNRAIEYPHPVLNEYTKDYPDSQFAIDVISQSDVGAEIVLELSCSLKCKGLWEVIDSGYARAILRVTCYKTSLRKAYDLSLTEPTIIKIAKHDVTDKVDLRAMVVATREINEFKLPEFNQEYFGGVGFKIRKGDILANEPGLTIKLNTTLERNIAGIVQVRGGGNSTAVAIHFPDISEDQSELDNYIMITLPDEDYKHYVRLMTKKHLKNGIERFVQAAIVLPAITEAVGKLRAEELFVDEKEEPITHFKGTIWADSIYEALRKHDITDLSESLMSNYEIANMLLDNVTHCSIDDLVRKLNEWSTIGEEDPTL